MDNQDKMKALSAALTQIEKQYGKGSVMKLGDNATNMNVEAVPTGSLGLDLALGMVEFQRDVLLRFMGRNPVVRPRLPSM